MKDLRRKLMNMGQQRTVSGEWTYLGFHCCNNPITVSANVYMGKGEAEETKFSPWLTDVSLSTPFAPMRPSCVRTSEIDTLQGEEFLQNSLPHGNLHA
jgi:hypothetical protein